MGDARDALQERRSGIRSGGRGTAMSRKARPTDGLRAGAALLLAVVLALCGVTTAHAAGSTAPPPVSDRAGTSAWTFTFGTAPTVTADVDPEPRSVPPGQSFSLSATARADEAATAGWEVSRDGGTWQDLPGAGTAQTTPTKTVDGVGQIGTTVATLALDAPVQSGAYYYRARFSNSLGSVSTSAAQIDVELPVNLPAATIVAYPEQIVADGAAVSTIVVSLSDASGEPVPGRDTVITTDAGQVSGTTDRHDGTYAATLTAPETPGTATLRFTVDGTQAPASTQVRFVPRAPSLTASTITADPTSLPADGQSTSRVTVTVLDDEDEPVPGRAVGVTTTGGTITPAQDQGDGTYVATLTSSTTAGEASLAFTIDGQGASATAAVTFVPGAPSPTGSTITADPTSIPADGRSTSTATVTLLDDHGNPVPGHDVVIATTAGDLTATTDEGDGTYTAVLTSPGTTGTTTLTFTIDGQDATGTAVVQLVPGDPSLTDSTIAADPTSITADGRSTSTATVTLLDDHGNLVPGRAVDITTTAGSITATQDQGDGTYVATLTAPVATGETTLAFSVDGQDARDTATVTFIPGDPSLDDSTIAADPTSLTAGGEDTSRITATLLDEHGNPVPGHDVVIATTGGTITATEDRGDGTYTATLAPSAATGSATLTFTVDGLDATASTTVTFTADQASLTDSTITADPSSITADGRSTSTATVTLLDDHGNLVPSRAVDVTTTAGSITPAQDQGDGTYTATLTAPTTAGAAALAFTIDGHEATRTAQVTFTPGDVSLADSTIEANPTSITADGESTSRVTATLRDAYGNAVPGHEVAFATTGGSIAAATDNHDGTYTADLTAPVATGAGVVSFDVDGEPAPSTATVAFTAGEASLTDSTITADPTSITADGESTSTVTMLVVDEHGNPVPDLEVVPTTTAGTITSATDEGAGVYRATLTSPVTAGSATLGFAIEGREAASTATVELTPGPVSLSSSTIAADPTSITADGRSTSEITVAVLDANANRIPGRDVRITSTAGSITATTDNGDGTYTATLTSSSTAGASTLAFTVDGQDAASTTAVTFTAGQTSLVDSTIAADPTSITADGESTSTITVRVLDSNGNAVPGRDVRMTSTAGTIGGPVVEGPDGTYTATLRSSTESGQATVAFTIDDQSAPATARVTFAPGAVDLDRSEIDADPTSIIADGESTSTITVTLRDAHANPVPGHEVTLATTAGTVTGATDRGDGTYTATLTAPTTTGAAVESFTVDGQAAPATATVALNAGDASTTRSTISADPTTIEADGRSRSAVTVTVLDAYGNPVPGREVHVTTTAGTISATEDQQDGTYTAFLTAPTTAGDATLAFTIDGRTADDTEAVTFAAGAVDLASATIGADPTSIQADGTSSSTVTARVTDAHGNPVSGRDVRIGTTAGSIGQTTDRGDGTYTATLTSSTALGSATLTFTVDDRNAPARTVVTFTVSDGTLTASTITANPSSLVADGVSTARITVTVLGADGTPVPGRDVVVTSTGGSISPTTDRGDGTYTASLRSPVQAGQATVAFTIDGRLAVATAQVAFVPGEASLVASSIGADPTSIEADGSSTTTATVRVLDDHANPISGRDVAITTTSGHISRTTDRGDGTYTATLTSPTAPGAARVGFVLDGREAPAGTMVSFTVGRFSDGSGVLSADESAPLGAWHSDASGRHGSAAGEGRRPWTLPVTGAEAFSLLAVALALLGVGAFLAAGRRSRRRG